MSIPTNHHDGKKSVQKALFMRRLLLTFLLIATVIAASLIPRWTTPAQAQTLRYLWERFDVDIIVQSDGTLMITEQQVFRFRRGSFGSIFRELPKEDISTATDWVIEDDEGNLYRQVDDQGEAEAYTFIVDETEDRYYIEWFFPAINRGRKAFNFTYTVYGGLRAADKGDELYWVAIFGPRDSVVQDGQIRITTPPDSQILDADAFVTLDGESVPALDTDEPVVQAELDRSGRIITFELNRTLSEREAFEAIAIFTTGIVPTEAIRRDAGSGDQPDDDIDSAARQAYEQAVDYVEVEAYADALNSFTTAIELEPTFIDAYYYRAELYAKLDQYEDALPDYSQTIELDERYVNGYWGRGIAYTNLGDPEAAIADYTKVIALSPTFADGYYYRGYSYASQGDYELAIEDYNEALTLDPERSRIYYVRGVAYEDLGEYEAALDDLGKAITFDPEYGLAYYNRGRVYEYLGEHALAVDDFDQAARLVPDDGYAYYGKGYNLAALGQYREALLAYNRAVRLLPDEPLPLINRGTVYMDLDQYQQAIADFDKALALGGGESASLYYNRGISYENLGDYTAALDDFDQAILLDPEHGRAYYNRGWTYEHMGEYDLAVDDFDQAARLVPDDGYAYYGKGYNLAALGQYREALLAYNQAIRLLPDEPLPLVNRGTVYMDLDQYQRAIADFDKALALGGDESVYLHYNRGVSYAELMDEEQALADYAQAIEIDPAYFYSYVARAILYIDSDRPEEALLDLEQAIELAPDYVLSYYWRGMAYRDLGEIDAAIADLERYLDLQPDASNSEDVAMLLAELQGDESGTAGGFTGTGGTLDALKPRPDVQESDSTDSGSTDSGSIDSSDTDRDANPNGDDSPDDEIVIREDELSLTRWEAIGESEGDMFGLQATFVGDVNGDGYDDALVSAPAYPEGEFNGRAYLYLGSADGLEPEDSWQVSGVGEAEGVGIELSGAGDVNGDGYADFMVSAPGIADWQGMVHLFHGHPDSTDFEANWVLEGVKADDYLGIRTASVGDINGDGYDDVLIQLRDAGLFNEFYLGETALYLGSEEGLSLEPAWIASGFGESETELFGQTLAGAGDVNGDGYDDLLIGVADTGDTSGQVELYHGSVAGLGDEADWLVSGEDTAGFGFAAAGAGDVNGDGYADVIVGSPYTNDYFGQALLYLGGEEGLALEPIWGVEGERIDELAGLMVGTAGDLNGDGYADIYYASLDEGGETISFHFYLGGAEGADAQPIWMTTIQPVANSVVQYILQQPNPGDANGDGYGDLLIGQAGADAERGRATLDYGGSIFGGAVIPDGSSPEIDFTDPASVVQTLFDAAQSGDFTLLVQLCDPLGKNDQDTQIICDIESSQDADLVTLFIDAFEKGGISGEVLYNRDETEANVPILFGVDGDERETMMLIKRDGAWYLLGF